MNVSWGNTSQLKTSASIVTIGTFDGVHVGHKKIISRLNELKEQHSLPITLLTFDPHPRKVLFPQQTDLKLLTTNDEKIQLLDQLGIDNLVVYPFTEAFANMEATDYVQAVLVNQLHAKLLVIGYDHRFGHNREGTISTLKAYGKQFNFEVEEIPAQDIDDVNISSTKIRKALLDGDIDTATKFLGYSYFLSGTVVRGKQLGRTIGYATANIGNRTNDKLLPLEGVYFVKVNTPEYSGYGMMNIGTNPTTDNTTTTKVEVFIFDFDKDIYDQSITVHFIKRLRPELKFNGLTELTDQLKKDEESCRFLMNS